MNERDVAGSGSWSLTLFIRPLAFSMLSSMRLPASTVSPGPRPHLVSAAAFLTFFHAHRFASVPCLVSLHFFFPLSVLRPLAFVVSVATHLPGAGGSPVERPEQTSHKHCKASADMNCHVDSARGSETGCNLLDDALSSFRYTFSSPGRSDSVGQHLVWYQPATLPSPQLRLLRPQAT